MEVKEFSSFCAGNEQSVILEKSGFQIVVYKIKETDNIILLFACKPVRNKLGRRPLDVITGGEKEYSCCGFYHEKTGNLYNVSAPLSDFLSDSNTAGLFLFQ